MPINSNYPEARKKFELPYSKIENAMNRTFHAITKEIFHI